jgi:hypothetical protein
VDQVEFTRRKLVHGKVELGDFAAAVRQISQVACVSVYGQDSTARRCGGA